MNFLIVGVGAIGGSFLAFLSRAGHRCAGLVKKGQELDTLKIEGIWGRFSQKVVTLSDLRSLDFTPDLVVISVKSYDTESALRTVIPVIEDNTYLLIAQNGYGNYEKAVEVFGEGKVILSRIIYGSEVLERGRIRITVCADDVIVGDPSGKIDENYLRSLAITLKEAGIPTRYDPKVYEFLWAKIIYNSALNPLGALLGVNYGWLADQPSSRYLMDRIIDEIFQILRAKGIRTLWNTADEFREAFYGELIPATKDHFPSMLKDIRRGKTEIDSLNGAICKLGEEVGIDTPYNKAITELVKARELITQNC